MKTRGQPPLSRIGWRATSRLISSRYPSVGILDRVASPDDLDLVIALEGWTNDRLSNELGILHLLPSDEWVTGPMASVVMAAYCHPGIDGGRFHGPERGAWYAARTRETAIAETVYRRTRELAEVGFFDTRVQMREYLADFDAMFHDVRAHEPRWKAVHDPDSHEASKRLGQSLLADGSNGIAYRSARNPGGECLACFRPKLVRNVRVGGHFEYRWQGSPDPDVRRL
jgi:RES domain